LLVATDVYKITRQVDTTLTNANKLEFSTIKANGLGEKDKLTKKPLVTTITSGCDSEMNLSIAKQTNSVVAQGHRRGSSVTTKLNSFGKDKDYWRFELFVLFKLFRSL